MPEMTPVTPQPAQETSRPASPAPPGGGWAGGLAGRALGVALALAVPRALSRTRRGSATLGVEPIDERTVLVRESASDPDDGSAWTPADELSWSGSRPG